MVAPSFHPRALFDHIARALGNSKDSRCDHSHRHAQAWCESNAVN